MFVISLPSHRPERKPRGKETQPIRLSHVGTRPAENLQQSTTPFKTADRTRSNASPIYSESRLPLLLPRLLSLSLSPEPPPPAPSSNPLKSFPAVPFPANKS
jgi:hypothetical protein